MEENFAKAPDLRVDLAQTLVQQTRNNEGQLIQLESDA
jgi:hypothetical protein